MRLNHSFGPRRRDRSSGGLGTLYVPNPPPRALKRAPRAALVALLPTPAPALSHERRNPGTASVYKHLFALVDSNILTNKETPNSPRGLEKNMAATGNTTTSTTQRKSAPRTTTTSRTDAQKVREGLTNVRNGSVSYARQTAERSVDVPVGAVLTVADRLNAAVEPLTSREAAQRELKSFRAQVERELNRLERRGAQSRRRVRTRARQTRNRFRRELRQRRPPPRRDDGQAEPREGRGDAEAGADRRLGQGRNARLDPLARAASRGDRPERPARHVSRADSNLSSPDRPAKRRSIVLEGALPQWNRCLRRRRNRSPMP
jgi:prefoldin subunit 5